MDEPELKLDKSDEKFDYGKFPAQVARTLRRYADEIITYKRKTVVMAGEAGRVLKAAQAEMEHGTFLQWVKGPAGLSRSVAYRLMDLIDAFGDELPVLGSLPVTTVQLLAAKSVPTTLRASILARAKLGEALQSKAILKEISDAKKARRACTKDTNGVQGFASQTTEQNSEESASNWDTHITEEGSDRQAGRELTYSALNFIHAIGADYFSGFLMRHGAESRRVFDRACEIIDASKSSAGQLIETSRSDFDRDDNSLDDLLGHSWTDQAVLDIAERIRGDQSVDRTMAVKMNNQKYAVIRGDKAFRAYADVLDQTAVPAQIIDISELENKFHN